MAIVAAEFCDVVGAASEIPLWLQGIDILEALQIPNTKLSSVNPVPQPAGVEGPAAKVNDWCGATIRHSGSWYIVGPSGGHAGYVGNETDAIQLNTNIPTWQEINEPTRPNSICYETDDVADLVDGGTGHRGGIYGDLKPASGHNGYTAQFLQNKDEYVLLFPRNPGGAGGGVHPTDWPYRRGAEVCGMPWSTKVWLHPDTYPHSPSYPFAALYSPTVTDLRTDEIYTCDQNWNPGPNGRFWKRNPTTGVFTSIGPGPAKETAYPLALDTTRDLIYSFAWPVSTQARRTPISSVLWSQPTFAGSVSALENAQTENMCAEYDPVNDCFWLIMLDFRNLTKSALFRIRASDLFVDEPTLTGISTLPVRINNWHNAMRYVPELKGLVGCFELTQDLLFIRTA